MRTQEELREYYQRIDPQYRGESVPEGWRFVDPEVENINDQENLMSNFAGWFVPDEGYNPSDYTDWVWITNLPLPDFAPENSPENTAKNSTKTNMKYNVKFGHVIYQGVSAASLAGVFNNGVSYELSGIVDCLDIFDYHSASIGVFDLEISPLYGYFTILTKDGKVPNFQTYSEIANFVYRKNRDEVNWRTLGVTEETDTYLCGIDLADNQFKKFLKDKILGGEVIEVNNQQG